MTERTTPGETGTLKLRRFHQTLLLRVLVLGVGFFAASSRLSLATAPAGQVVSWGTVAIPNVKPGTVFTNIESGGVPCFAFTSDGRLVGWGFDFYGQLLVPGDLTNIVAVAANG